MAYLNFPNTIYDQPQNLLAVLGSWWADTYAGRDQVTTIVEGKCQLENQSMLDLMELIAALSRFTVPIYHTDNWYPLYLLASQRNDAQTSLLRYGDGVQYDNGNRYDIPQSRPAHAFPRPANLMAAPLVMNRFTDPTLLQNENVDYVLIDNAIIFRQNPFNDPRVATRVVYQDGIPVDTEALLWVYRGQFDWDTIYQQFAYVIGMRLKSSAGYRDLMNAVFDAMVGGTTYADIMRAFSAMTGIPLVQEATEKVVDMVVDTENLVIITDQHVYKFGLSAVPVVAVGDVLHRGAALTDALRIYELNCGIVPDGLSSLAMGQGFLATCFYSDLVFENKDVPLIVDEHHPSGYTKVSWSLGGFPLDVDHFFDEMHARGVVEASIPVDECDLPTKTIRYPVNNCDEQEIIGRRGTLAHYLDLRPNQTGEPTASQLPRTINPLRFLVENILRNNACIIRMKAAAGVKGVGLQNVRLLRKVLPPQTALILLMDLTAVTDSVTVDSVTETITPSIGMTPLRDEVVNMVRDSRLTVRVVNGTCH